MKINPSIHKKKLLYPMAAAVVLSGCQQQQHSQRLSGAPLPPPEVQLEPVVKPQEKSETTHPQRLGGKKPPRHMRQNRENQLIPGRARANHPLPGKKRASR